MDGTGRVPQLNHTAFGGSTDNVTVSINSPSIRVAEHIKRTRFVAESKTK